jgi:uncharacterized protein (TIGR02265 family)
MLSVLKCSGLVPILTLVTTGAVMDANATPEAKGAGFNTVAAVIRTMLGPKQFESVTRALPPATAALVKQPPLPMQWLSCDRFGDLISISLRHGFNGDEQQLVEVGRKSLVHDLNTLYRMFVKLLSPRYVIDRGAKLWLTYNRNNGTLRAVQTGDHSCDVFYERVACVYPGFWAYQRGCLMAAMEATGYRKATITLVRGGGSGGDAQFTLVWGS